MVCFRNISVNTSYKDDYGDDNDTTTTTTTTTNNNNNNNNNNTFLHYLCVGKTTTRPITQTAQEYKKNTQIQATNKNTSKRSNKLHIKITNINNCLRKICEMIILLSVLMALFYSIQFDKKANC